MGFSNVSFSHKTKQTELEQTGPEQTADNLISISLSALAAACTLVVTFLGTTPASAQLQEVVPSTGCFVEWSSGNRLNLDGICSDSVPSVSGEVNNATNATSPQISSNPQTVIFINRTPIISRDATPSSVSPAGFVSTPDAFFPGAFPSRSYAQPTFTRGGILVPGFRRRLLEPIEFSPVPIISQ
ncbi:MAG: hypothetical protein AAFQ74_08325 [Cyanobacteria bacterium J06623_4]